MSAETDKADTELVRSMIGHTIVNAEWFVAIEDWSQGEERALLTLDDGRVIRFGGWGYDAWGATVDLEATP